MALLQCVNESLVLLGNNMDKATIYHDQLGDKSSWDISKANSQHNFCYVMYMDTVMIT